MNFEFSIVCPRVIFPLLLLFLLVFPAPVWAAAAPERTTLTVELLQKQLNAPIQENGFSTIDLRQLVIDLTLANAEFRDQFYQQLRSSINRSKKPLGIDLSQSLIQGEFKASEIGLQTPLAGEALSSLLTSVERERLQEDPRIAELSNSQAQAEMIPYVTVLRGPIKLVDAEFSAAVDFSNTFFLQRLEASGVTFEQQSNWSKTSFGRFVDFARARFAEDARFSESNFLAQTNFSQAQFQGVANFSEATYQKGANFKQANFTGIANWVRSHWLADANFTRVSWGDRVFFSKSRFSQSLLLSSSTFERTAAFRKTRFSAPIDFQSANLLGQVDFSNAAFLQDASLNVAGVAFDSDEAKIIGDTGKIGGAISVPTLEGNENVLRNLILNFRSLEQVPDANQIEYMMQQLRLRQLGTRVLGTTLQQRFAGQRVRDAAYWLGLSLLLLLSDYGTNFSLVLSVGIVAFAYFGVLFWFIDRVRRRVPQPILPTTYETSWVLSSFAVLTLIGMSDLFQSAERPGLTLACLGAVLFPVPLLLVGRLYRQGRYHDLINLTYFVENGGMRQLRLLIARLPIMPRFPFFRDRFMPILWDRRWNWLNYYDFSLNNLLKLGFNDIRVRDQHLPGIIATLVWYQWTLGLLYVALLLWTFSRTIPGLNLLIYLQ